MVDICVAIRPFIPLCYTFCYTGGAGFSRTTQNLTGTKNPAFAGLFVFIGTVSDFLGLCRTSIWLGD